MALKLRIITKLNILAKQIKRAMVIRDVALLRYIHDTLQWLRVENQKGLPADTYASYGEIYDTLIFAVQQVMAGEPRAEILPLCLDLLHHIVDNTNKEQNFKKEIFFLPYKYSMWDSLESVWQAACEDYEHTLTYVMPIPYADRNPDGTVAEWHYERGEFPKTIPTLDYQEINLQEWHPDIIVYHNPYDNYNAVTSVDGTYYSTNLLNCADKLVYIPYFVLPEPNINYDNLAASEEEEDKIAHFITAPGVRNADLVVVQSEAMKKVYVSVLSRYTTKGEGYWNEHISGLGSPKFDKVQNSTREDFELPIEWQNIIRGRRTILYNTSLTAVIEHSENYLKKIRYVLGIFKNHQDVALWWRPHPLLRSTIRSMHPKLLSEYDDIVNSYRKESWGIYDDSAELEKALAYTDGYYGDWSSLVQLYKKMGKMVFIQNCREDTLGLQQFNGNSHFMDVAHHRGYVYFSETRFNGLFRCKEGDNQAEFLGRFPGEEPWQGDLHRNVFASGEKLYFIPMNGHGISAYDCSKGTFYMLRVPGAEDDYVCFDYCIKSYQTLLLIPMNFGTPFVLFNLKTEQITILLNISMQIMSLLPLPARYEVFSVHSGVCVDGCLYLAVSSSNILLKISLDDYHVKKIILPIEIHLRYMSFIDGTFYFTAQEHLIAAWREYDNHYQIYEMPYEPVDFNYPYLKVERYKDNLYIVSGREDRFWKFTPHTGGWIDLFKKIPLGFEREFRGALLFLGYEVKENKMILYPRAGNGMLVFDLENEEFSFKRVQYASKLAKFFHNDWVDMIFDSGLLFVEWDLALEDYIHYMGKTNDSSAQEQEMKKSLGECVYQKIIEEVKVL